MNKGLARFIFLIVFFIPVAWYLFLQLFGDNSFSLELKYPINDCLKPNDVLIVRTSDSVSMAENNYLQRVIYGAEKRSVTLEQKGQDFFQCINQSEADLVLVNEKGLWGGYELTREGVDLLLTELDILILQESYGEGAYR